MSEPTKPTQADPLDLRQPPREDLQVIIERHRRDENAYACVDSLNRSATRREPPHTDRGALLDLLLRLAKAPAVINLPEGGKVCTRCGALSEWMTDGPPKCDPECPAPLLEALR